MDKSKKGSFVAGLLAIAIQKQDEIAMV